MVGNIIMIVSVGSLFLLIGIRDFLDQPIYESHKLRLLICCLFPWFSMSRLVFQLSGTLTISKISWRDIFWSMDEVLGEPRDEVVTYQMLFPQPAFGRIFRWSVIMKLLFYMDLAICRTLSWAGSSFCHFPQGLITLDIQHGQWFCSLCNIFMC